MGGASTSLTSTEALSNETLGARPFIDSLSLNDPLRRGSTALQSPQRRIQRISTSPRVRSVEKSCGQNSVAHNLSSWLVVTVPLFGRVESQSTAIMCFGASTWALCDVEAFQVTQMQSQLHLFLSMFTHKGVDKSTPSSAQHS